MLPRTPGGAVYASSKLLLQLMIDVTLATSLPLEEGVYDMKRTAELQMDYKEQYVRLGQPLAPISP